MGFHQNFETLKAGKLMVTLGLFPVPHPTYSRALIIKWYTSLSLGSLNQQRKLYTVPIPLLIPLPYKQAITPVILKKKEILPIVFPRPYPEPYYEAVGPHYEVPKDKYPIFWD